MINYCYRLIDTSTQPRKSERANMKNLLFLGVFLMMTALTICSFAEDGKYEATVTTDDGVFTALVEAAGGRVTLIRLPDNKLIYVSNADIDEEGNAVGTDLNGKTVKIEIDGYGWPTNADSESVIHREEN